MNHCQYHGQKFNAGVSLASTAWFVLRMPRDEKRCEGQIPAAARIQRRLVHLLSQSAEEKLLSKLSSSVSAMSARDLFYPAPMDGRKIMRESKVKHVLKLDRFLSKGSGFASTTDATLGDSVLLLSRLFPQATHQHEFTATPEVRTCGLYYSCILHHMMVYHINHPSILLLLLCLFLLSLTYIYI